MKLSDIYDRFSIPDNLRTHMLRVAGVGKVICDNLSPDIKIDKDALIKALLVHDMGNIVKFDFSVKSIHTDPDEISRLKQIQSEFIDKYGADDHKTTENILREIKLSEDVISITQNMSSKKLEKTLIEEKWTLMIATYCDLRVSPFGIVPLNKRIDDLVSRMKGRTSSDWSSLNKAEKYRIDLNRCEKIIQKYCLINLKDVNDQLVEKYFDDFLKSDIN